MHLLIVPSWYPTLVNPVAGIFFQEQARALQVCGYQVGVLVPPRLVSKRSLLRVRRGTDLITQIGVVDDGGILTYRAAQIGWFPGFLPQANQRLRIHAGLRQFERYCKDNGRPDVIHAHSIIYGGYLASRIGKRWRIPTVLTEHSTAVLQGRIRSYQRQLIRDTLETVQYRLAVGPSLVDALHGFAPEQPIEILGNIVDTEFFSFDSASNPDAFTFCTVAVLTKRKGIDLLLRALSQTSGHKWSWPPGERSGHSTPPFLHIGGDGPARTELEELAKALGITDRVSFHGRLEREGIRELIQNSHVMISSSYVETFGVTLIEAMACGKPVIATRSGGPESFVNDANGLLVPTGDASALAAAMNQIAAEYSKYDPNRIRSECVDKFGVEAIVGRLQQIYETVACP